MIGWQIGQEKPSCATTRERIREGTCLRHPPKLHCNKLRGRVCPLQAIPSDTACCRHLGSTLQPIWRSRLAHRPHSSMPAIRQGLPVSERVYQAPAHRLTGNRHFERLAPAGVVSRHNLSRHLQPVFQVLRTRYDKLGYSNARQASAGERCHMARAHTEETQLNQVSDV